MRAPFAALLLAPLLSAAPALAQSAPARATIEFGTADLWRTPAFWVFPSSRRGQSLAPSSPSPAAMPSPRWSGWS